MSDLELESYLSDLREDEDEAYLGEDEDEAYLGEDEDEAYLGEARRRSVIRPRTGSRSYSRNIRGTSIGRIVTPRGSANVRFGQPMVSKRELQIALEKVRADIKKNSTAVSSVDRRYSDISNRLNSSVKDAKQQAMMPLLLTSMQSKGEIDQLKGKSDTSGEVTTFTASETKWKSSDDNTLMLVLLMSMMGGFGGTGKSDDMMMVLLLTQAFKS